MRNLLPLFLLVVFIVSCSQNPEESTDQSETLRLTNTSLQKMVDLQLDRAIFMDEQRGRHNEELVAQLKQLASSRKSLDFKDLTGVEDHLTILKQPLKDRDDLNLDRSFDRVETYLAKCQHDSKGLPLLQAEISNIEFVIIEHLSRQMGIIDCCFPSLIKVQTNGVGVAGEVYEMAIFPNGEKALWGHASYAYENIHLTQMGRKISTEMNTNQIGHVITVQFALEEAGEYLLHFSVTESGDYLTESWQQDFQWPVLVR